MCRTFLTDNIYNFLLALGIPVFQRQIENEPSATVYTISPNDSTLRINSDEKFSLKTLTPKDGSDEGDDLAQRLPPEKRTGENKSNAAKYTPAFSESRLQISSEERFGLKSLTQEDEDAYVLAQHLPPEKHTGKIGTIAQLVKGALGIGLLGGHEAYQKCGLVTSCILQFLCGIYMTYCMVILIRSSHIICKRLQTYNLSYSDIGEAALAMCPNKKLARFHRVYRYMIDVIICIDLFGSCVCYQLVISKTLKQLVENDSNTNIGGLRGLTPVLQQAVPFSSGMIPTGYPDLRVYLAIMVIPCIVVCLITNLKLLTPIYILANCFIVVAIFTTICYSIQENPSFEGLKLYGNLNKMFLFIAMTEFSMSCSGILVSVCNHMEEPEKYRFVIVWSMCIIVFFLFVISFFGMNAYRQKCHAPITLNFPMTLFPKVLKALIAIMVYITHSLNFYTPFHVCWHYLKRLHKPHYDNPAKMLKIEKMYRAGIVVLLTAIAISFPAVAAVTGFTGSLCLSNMAFIWPNIIEVLVIWPRPGFGRFHWRLWKSLILISIGTMLLIKGTALNIIQMLKIFESRYAEESDRDDYDQIY